MAINDKRQPQQPSVNSMEDIGKIAGNSKQPTKSTKPTTFFY